MWPRRQRSGKRFQSTPARSRRPFLPFIPGRSLVFQSTPARSRRRLFPAIIGLVLDFNPLQREAGDDQEPFTPRIILISIHSSAKPETSYPYFGQKDKLISIHSSAKPETRRIRQPQYIILISIHSSAKPETAIITNFHLYSTHFLIQINQYFIFSTPFLHQSLYHNALFPVRIP